MGMLLQRHYEAKAAKTEALRSAQQAEVDAARAQQAELALRRAQEAHGLAELEAATAPEPSPAPTEPASVSDAPKPSKPHRK